MTIRKNEKRLTVDLPEKIFKGLKALAIAKNMTMKKLLVEELTRSFKSSRPCITWDEKG